MVGWTGVIIKLSQIYVLQSIPLIIMFLIRQNHWFHSISIILDSRVSLIKKKIKMIVDFFYPEPKIHLELVDTNAVKCFNISWQIKHWILYLNFASKAGVGIRVGRPGARSGWARLSGHGHRARAWYQRASRARAESLRAKYSTFSARFGLKVFWLGRTVRMPTPVLECIESEHKIISGKLFSTWWFSPSKNNDQKSRSDFSFNFTIFILCYNDVWFMA